MDSGQTTDAEMSRKALIVLEEQSALVKVSTHPLVKAVIGTVPFSGGVSSLLGDWAQRRQEVRLRQFLLDVALQVEHNRDGLRDKIDRDFVRSEEFAATIEFVLQEAAQTTDKDKVEFLKNFIFSAALHDRPDVTWQDLFMKYVRQLSGVHLVVLAVFHEIQGNLPPSDRLGGAEIPSKVPLGVAAVSDRLPDVDAALLNVACIDLCNLGLIADWRAIRPSAKTIQNDYCLTESGAHFMRFLLASQG